MYIVFIVCLFKFLISLYMLQILFFCCIVQIVKEARKSLKLLEEWGNIWENKLTKWNMFYFELLLIFLVKILVQCH
jgi:hypothetical protein